MKLRGVEIEFTEDTFGPDGDIQRNKGDRLFVDPGSAHSFCDVKKVARRTGDEATLSNTKAPPKRRTRAKAKPKGAPDERNAAVGD
jgi:hypothetical protein